jgi:His/Glu/Gln/Arg/opine family amino acid ABC transporter permease subunit
MDIDFGVVVTYLPHLLKAAVLTIFITVASQFFGTVFGLGFALARTSSRKWLATAVAGYVWIVRGTPMLLHLFFIYYAAPIIGLTLDALPAAIIAMSLSSTAYNSEIFRAGIQAVHHGQIEAARAVGMTYAQTMRRIALPQALRIIIPPYMSNFISHTKNSSLASVITVPELMLTAQMIASSTYRVLEILTAAGAIYLCLTSGLTWLQRYLERATAYEKRGLSDRRRRALGLVAES